MSPSADSSGLDISSGSPKTWLGRTSDGWVLHVEASPLRLMALRVRHDSAPPIITASTRPAAMSSHARSTSWCGVWPPPVVYIVWVGVRPSRSGDQAPRIGVTPRHDVHHPDRADRVEHAPGAARRSATVVGRPADRLGQQVHGLGRVTLAVGDLADPDQHGLSGVEGQRPFQTGERFSTNARGPSV